MDNQENLEKSVESGDIAIDVNQKTYVHDGSEVIKTGRVAIKEVSSRRGSVSTVKLFEVCPLKMVNVSNAFNSWVEETELFNIIEE